MSACAAIITPKGEGCVRVAAGKAWPRSRSCLLRAKENGYCWRHQRAAKLMAEARGIMEQS